MYLPCLPFGPETITSFTNISSKHTSAMKYTANFNGIIFFKEIYLSTKDTLPTSREKSRDPLKLFVILKIHFINWKIFQREYLKAFPLIIKQKYTNLAINTIFG